jgi:uncharacterized protein (DUF1499 family)
MTAKLRERRSTLALWSWRFSLVSVPVLIIAAIGHRIGLLDATPTYGAMALGFVLAALGVFCAGAAFEAIWRDGRKGLAAAVRGLLLGLLVLVLPVAAAWKLVTYPRLYDISTDPENPPALVFAASDRPADARPIEPPTEEDAEIQRDAYPDILPRHYPVGPARVYEDALELVTRNGWRVLGVHEPAEGDETGAIEAVAQTEIFGFRQDVSIRIEPDGEGSLVDMRSTARNGEHDLGANAERIRLFLAALDASLQGISEDDEEPE